MGRGGWWRGQGETEMELEMGGQQRRRAGEMRGRGQETEVQKRRKAAMRGVKTERRKKNRGESSGRKCKTQHGFQFLMQRWRRRVHQPPRQATLSRLVITIPHSRGASVGVRGEE